MNLLRYNAEADFSRIDTHPREEKKFAQEACRRLTINTVYSSASSSSVTVEECTTNENALTAKIARGRLSDVTRPLGETPGQPAPYLELVFLPPPEKLSDNFPKPKGFSITKRCFHMLFEYLGLDYALLGYLTSSRSGWYCVRGQNDCHAFLYKDYLYTLAWTFNPKTGETRGMLAARSDFRKYSNLCDHKGELQLPKLSKALLDQPFLLAFIALMDCADYLERVILDYGYSLSDLEKLAKMPDVNDHKTKMVRLEQVEDARRQVTKLIKVFLAFFKTVDIALLMARTIQQSEPPVLPPYKMATLLEDPTQLLEARIASMRMAGDSTIRRAESLFSAFSGSVAYREAVSAAEDSSSMKAIAMMTMLFLPATFIAALWAVPALDVGITKESFWFYWATTVPITVLVFGSWYGLKNRRLLTWAGVFTRALSPRAKEDADGRDLADPEMGLIGVTQAQPPEHGGTDKSGKSC